MIFSAAAIAGVCLKHSRIFFSDQVMSLNCSSRSSLSCRFPSNSKPKKAREYMHESDSVWRWKWKMLFLVILSGFSWLFYGLDMGIQWIENGSSLLFGEIKDQFCLQEFNVAQVQFRGFADKTGAHASCAEQFGGSSNYCLVSAGWWVFVGVVLTLMCSRMFGFCLTICSNRQQDLVHSQQSSQQQQKKQLVQPKRQHVISSSKSIGKWWRKLVDIGVVCWVLVSFYVFFRMKADINLRRNETLVNMCDERARVLQDQFNVSMNHVHALAILVSTFHHGTNHSAMDQKTFDEYTERTAFERPLTSGVAYALKVLHSEREEFEKRHGWTIKKMDIGDQTLVQDCNPENMDPAPIQDEYAPVIFSQRTVSHIVSIDMMSGKEDRENILRARATGKGVLTSPFKLLKSNHLGVVLTFAVYNAELPPDSTAEQRIAATVGYLGASYDVPSLVEKLLQQLASKQTIVVNVYDTTNVSAPITMYGTDVIDTGLLRISTLDFGDPSRKHEMHCRFKHKPSLPWPAISTCGGILVITVLVGHSLYAALDRIVEVEEDCRQMTELKGQAEAADVAKSQFLATVSHEIRTPMNGVLGMLQMLMDTDLDANQLDYAQTAHNSGKDLISLINELLDQAKIESGRLELEAVTFDLRAILDNTVSLFSGKSREKGIELAVYVSNQVPMAVIGDPGRFRQIITNLVGNSIKFTDKGHIFVSVHVADEIRAPPDSMDEVLKQSFDAYKDGLIECKNTLSGVIAANRWYSWANFKKLGDRDVEESGRIKLLVTVEDTGNGIQQDAQGRIFSPFMQADSSTSRTYGGTGIGLSISKSLVGLMEGEIGFVSKLKTGSTFSFTVVLTKGEPGSIDAKWPQIDCALSEFKGMTALVIDGKSVRAEVIRYHLQRLGILAEKSSELESIKPYLSACNRSSSVLLSMVLIVKDVLVKEPHIALHQLLKDVRLNGSAEAAFPKIILLAPSISLAERSELKSSGLIDNVLTEPLRLNVLISCLQETFANGRRQRRNRTEPTILGSLLIGKEILVVDDNMVNRRVAEGALKKYGAIVTCVGSGEAALEKLKLPHNFTACFMDLQMPEMDGFEATRKIREMEEDFNERSKSEEVLDKMLAKGGQWHLPILAMTADVIQGTHEECTKCGMDGYVSKPFGEEQLYNAVAHFLESG